MNVQHVPLEWVAATWPVVEPMLERALAYNHGEYTAEQAKMLVLMGQWVLFVAVKDGVIHGAATVWIYNRPNDRVAFVTAAGGAGILTADVVSQLKSLVCGFGATVFECAGRPSVIRLLSRLGLNEKYRTVGVRL